MKEIISTLLAKNDSEDCSEEEDLDLQEHSQTSEDDEDGDGEMVADDENDEDVLPEAIQSLEFKDVYVCMNTACGGEVTEGFCNFCGKQYQLLEVRHDRWSRLLWLRVFHFLKDEFATRAISTESQTDHPDRDIAPRGDTPLREIDEHVEIPEAYASRKAEYKELLRRGATPEMCDLFYLQFHPNTGICAWLPEDIFNEFAGPAMEDEDEWQIYLGRRVTLEENDVDGREFVKNILDDISALPDVGNWATEEESPGTWVTYPKFRGELQIERPDIMDSMYASEDDIDVPVHANDYDLSDDNSEQADLEMDDPGFFTTSGIAYNHVDRWYVHPDEAMSVHNSEDENHEEAMEENNGHGDSSTISDSDVAGSDFDSDEVLTGDEQVLAQRNS